MIADLDTKIIWVQPAEGGGGGIEGVYNTTMEEINNYLVEHGRSLDWSDDAAVIETVGEFLDLTPRGVELFRDQQGNYVVGFEPKFGS